MLESHSLTYDLPSVSIREARGPSGVPGKADDTSTFYRTGRLSWGLFVCLFIVCDL